jgi:hypothetical protein
MNVDMMSGILFSKKYHTRGQLYVIQISNGALAPNMLLIQPGTLITLSVN